MNNGAFLVILGGVLLGLAALLTRIPLEPWALFTDDKETKQVVRAVSLCIVAALGMVCVVAGVANLAS